MSHTQTQTHKHAYHSTALEYMVLLVTVPSSRLVYCLNFIRNIKWKCQVHFEWHHTTVNAWALIKIEGKKSKPTAWTASHILETKMNVGIFMTVQMMHAKFAADDQLRRPEETMIAWFCHFSSAALWFLFRSNTQLEMYPEDCGPNNDTYN